MAHCVLGCKWLAYGKHTDPSKNKFGGAGGRKWMSHSRHEHDINRNLKVAFLLNLVFTLLEVAGGL